MAITVNGFGGGGGGESRTGTYYLKVINAGSAVLSGLTVDNNPSPAVSSMQEMLNIDGPGRLLLLAAYGNAYNQNKLQYYGDTTQAERKNGVARVRVAADSRVIYKACRMVRPTIEISGDSSHTLDGRGDLPSLVEDIFFTNEIMNGQSNTRLSGGISFQFRPSELPFLPAPSSQSAAIRREITIDSLRDYTARDNTSATSTRCDLQYPASYFFHTPDDDGTKTAPDYCCSLFPGGLNFDGNLTIHAAYGIAPTAIYPNGIVVLYELYDD